MKLKFDDGVPRYPKINSIFKRDSKGNFYAEYSQHEFEYLKDCTWIGTEKIDGMNIRLYWDGTKFAKIMGRKGKSQIPVHLQDKLKEVCDSLDLSIALGFPGLECVLFGEGYGHKIQHGGLYLGKDVDFILFDILWKDKMGNWVWVDQDMIEHTVGIKYAPRIFEGNLDEAIEFVKDGFKSTIGTANAEGLVLHPKCELRTKYGDRITVKIKTKDWKKK